MTEFSSTTRSRRSFIVTSAGNVLSLWLAKQAKAQVSRTLSDAIKGSEIRKVGVAAATTILNSSGDTWVTAWGDDGNLYSPSNDTGGFHGLDLVRRVLPDLTSDQVNRLEADPDAFLWDKELTKEQRDRLRREGPGGPIAFNCVYGPNPLALDGITVNWMREFSQQDEPVTEIKDHFGKKIKMSVDGRTWKSSGCISVSGALYWMIARDKYGEVSGDPHLRQTSINASVIKSTDFGKTWTRSPDENLHAPMFPGSQFAKPYFIDYGRNPPHLDGSDRYVYAVSNNGFWDNGDQLILGRVPRDRIGLLNPADWEFLSGSDGSLAKAWTPQLAEASPILERKGQLGASGVTYLPDRGRYMLIAWHYPAGGGKIKDAHTKTIWDFYESPKPWGPWIQIGSYTWSPEGYYCPAICSKFQSSNRVYVITAGDWTNPAVYRLTLVALDLT